MVRDIHKLKHNSTDAYTLNHTSHVITVLEAYIGDHDPKSSFAGKVALSGSTKASSFYATEKEPLHLIQKELDLVQELKSSSELIRDQVGSPETTPKGLIISFMVHLCDAIHRYEEIYRHKTASNPQLLNLIRQEIRQLRKTYPDLAKVGEDLQKAIANYQQQKP